MNTTTHTASTTPLIPMADPNPQPYEAVRFNALKHGILSRYWYVQLHTSTLAMCLGNAVR